MRQHAPRRKHRIPRRQHRPPPMRHLLQLPFPRVARAALLLPPPTPRRQPQLHLFRLPLPPHHPAPPTNPAVLLGDRFYGGGLTQERGEASCEAGCGGAPSRDESASGRARWSGEEAFRRARSSGEAAFGRARSSGEAALGARWRAHEPGRSLNPAPRASTEICPPARRGEASRWEGEGRPRGRCGRRR